MAATVPPEVEASYTTIIDSILAASDLNTISEKRIRKGLEAAVKDDLTPQKVRRVFAERFRTSAERAIPAQHLIKRLIMARFDKFHAETSAAPSSPAESPAGSVTNGHGVEDGSLSDPVSNMKPSLAAAGARGKLEAEDDEWERGEAPSMVVAAPPKPPKKKRKLEDEDEDARLAAMLQAEEDRRARKTRGAASRKPVPVKKRKTSSSKAKSTTKGEDDSSAVSESEEKKKRKVNKNGGFHVSDHLCDGLVHMLWTLLTCCRKN